MKNLIKTIFVSLFALLTINVAMAQKEAKKAEKADVTVEFTTDLDCGSCVKRVMDTLPYKRGVKDVDANLETKIVIVTFDKTKTSIEQIVEHLANVRVNATLAADSCDTKSIL